MKFENECSGKQSQASVVRQVTTVVTTTSTSVKSNMNSTCERDERVCVKEVQVRLSYIHTYHYQDAQEDPGLDRSNNPSVRKLV